MKDLTLVLCDREEEYAHQMAEYFLRSTGISWCVRTYTKPEELLRLEGMEQDSRKQADILLLAENAYVDGVTKLPVKCLVVLEEERGQCLESYPHILKYQAADEVLRALVEIYADKIKDFKGTCATGVGTTHMIGFYSPVHRCMQTTFSLALGLELAERNKTLYLSMEYFSSQQELRPEEQARDLGDLLYFLHTQEEKFPLRLQTCVQHLGALDYIPSIKVGENLLGVTPGEWLKLFQKLSSEGRYEYIVLDLSENLQGLFQILRSCEKVVTIGKTDTFATVKLTRYEELLQQSHMEDVLKKTYHLVLPLIADVPESWEEYGDGRLREQIRVLLEELIGGGK